MQAIRSSSPSFVLSLLLGTAIGCAPEPAGPPVDDVAPPRAASITGTVLAADGVPIVYETRGAGETAVVFIHCWACNRGFWRHQVEPLAEAGYRIVTLDLPGHGESGAERAEWSIAGLAADVQRVVDELDLERVVLVGHSMGGPVSLAAARRIPGRVAGIACVDTLHNVEFEWPEGMAEDLVRRMQEDYRAGMEYFVPQLFKGGADPEVVQWVIDQAVASDHAATIALVRDFPRLDMGELLSRAGVPVRCINAAPEGEEGFPTAVEINRKYADFAAVLMEGVGHYPQLERPEEFNERLLAMVAELRRGATRFVRSGW